MNEIRIEGSWKKALEDVFEQSFFTALRKFVKEEYLTKTVYPSPGNVFRAFDLCPIDDVKVVIVGQDPYHGRNQANGLSFAVNEGVPLPPSLQNIFKEIKDDTGVAPHRSGDLSRWAKQGVFMLNAVLTVAAGQPTSHKGMGWEQFTDAVIATLNAKRENIVYMLWGKYAQTKGLVIDRERNLVLESGHPSPYSAHLFFGNHHFTRCNDYLSKHGREPVDWR